MTNCITSHLLQLNYEALKSATRHPFLSAAAKNRLPIETLKTWLAQDKLYQQAYINFISGLLVKVVVPNNTDRTNTLQWRAADLLIDALTNIRAEMELFDEIVDGRNWADDMCDVVSSIETKAYQDLFAGAAAPNRSLLEGLSVFWATEQCYLLAWQYARSQVDDRVHTNEQGVVQSTLIPNWTSDSFEAFVKRIRTLVDDIGKTYEKGGYEWKQCEIAWRQVLKVERDFWPGVGT